MAKQKDTISNFLPLSRKFFDHDLWMTERVFSGAEAWLDLLQSASWGEDNGKIIRGRWVKWGRGQMPISYRYLGDRWKWSKDRVKRFCEELRREKMIEIETGNETAISILTICKYDEYNSTGKKSRQQPRQRRDSGEDSDKDSDKDKINITNNAKEDENNKERGASDFEKFWKCYDKDVGKKEALEEWQKLSEEEQAKALGHVKQYVAAHFEKQFRKNPSNYLKQKAFNDEIIKNGKSAPSIDTGVPKPAEAFCWEK